jgi:DNA-binding MarR family transcriptional regulator
LREVIDLLLQASRALQGESDVEQQLTASQWVALRFFSRANTFCRTLSGLAAYQATTAAPASQTIKFLEQAGYIERGKSEEDARSSFFTVTEAGKRLLRTDPLLHLTEQVKGIDPTRMTMVRDFLRYLIANIGGQQARHPFGTCRDCSFLLKRRSQSQDKKECVCKVLDVCVPKGEFDLICKNFQPLVSPFLPQNPTDI